MLQYKVMPGVVHTPLPTSHRNAFCACDDGPSNHNDDERHCANDGKQQVPPVELVRGLQASVQTSPRDQTT